MTLDYRRTLIAVADDCPVAGAVVPVPRGDVRTVAVVQYELLSGQPFQPTQRDVLFETWVRRQPGRTTGQRTPTQKIRLTAIVSTIDATIEKRIISRHPSPPPSGLISTLPIRMLLPMTQCG